MKLNLDEIYHRMEADNDFKNKLKKFLLISGIAIVLFVVLGVVGIVFFSSAIISFLFSNFPGIFELGFNYVRDLVGTLMLRDLTAILIPLAGSSNVNELQNLVTQYFNQLSINPAIDFKNFQSFITTVKNSLLDKQISNTELELVRQFLLN